MLALRYIDKPLPYARAAFTAFIAYAFGHNLGVASFTGAAVRYRLYASSGLSAADVAAVAVFCSVTTAIGLAVLAGGAFLAAPAAGAAALHLPVPFVGLVGVVLLAAVARYALWSLLQPAAIEVSGWALRAPRPGVALPQILLAVVDLSCSAAVLWFLLPADAPVTLPLFVGVYAVAITAGVISHVPGGLGVFESVIVLALPGVPPVQLAGALLAWRAVYYALPLCVAALMFGGQQILAIRPRLSRLEQLVGVYVTPVVPQVSGALVFLAGFLLLVSGATPAIDSRISLLWRALPLAVLEISHLAGSVIGLALLVLARALFRRLAAAYQLTIWLLAAGIVASLLKGLEVEQVDRAGGGARHPLARPPRLLSSGRDHGGALHAGVDREPGHRDLHRRVGRVFRPPSRRVFTLTVVDLRAQGRRAAHAARFAHRGAAGGRVPGDEPAAALATGAGPGVVRRSAARARPARRRRTRRSPMRCSWATSGCCSARRATPSSCTR